MTDLVLPEALRDVEPVRSIRTPARLDYRFTAGSATSRFLRGIAEKQHPRRALPGVRQGLRAAPGLVPDRRRAHRPSRSSCPTAASSPRFCVVNVEFYGPGASSCPTCAPPSLPDGGRHRPVRPHPGDPVRRGPHGHAGRGGVGRRRRARAPTSTSIKWWRPTGEPDADYETLQGARLMRDVAVVAFAQSRPRAPRSSSRNEVEMVMPVLHEVKDDARPRPVADRLHLLGQHRLPGRPGLQLRHDPRRRGRLAADQRDPRRDGRGLGAVRGLGQDPDRRGRHRPRLQLRQVVAGRRCRDVLTRQLDPYYQAPAVARRRRLAALQARACIDAGVTSVERDGRDRRPQPRGRRPTTPTPTCRGPTIRRAAEGARDRAARCASTTARRSPTAPPPSSWRPATGPAS